MDVTKKKKSKRLFQFCARRVARVLDYIADDITKLPCSTRRKT